MTMPEFETIQLIFGDRGIATLHLNRPNQHNAMNALMIEEITKATNICGSDKTIRAVLLSAEGKSFCAGGDLNWMREQADNDRVHKMEEARKLADMLFALNTLPKPLIGRVHGNAFGGGVGLMAVCDVVVAHKDAKFGLTETRLGLIPATIGPFVIKRLGEGFARQVFFNAKIFGSDLALRSGLVSMLADDLDSAIEREIKYILKTAPEAVSAAKALCQNLSGSITKEEIEVTIETLADQWESEEAQIGISAFLNKESPPWES